VFNARKKDSQDRNHCCFSADHRIYSGVLGSSMGRDFLGGIPALAEVLK